MTKDELEIIECALVQLLMKYKNQEKEIRKLLNKVHDMQEHKEEIEVID